jgi:hypothetical protein
MKTKQEAFPILVSKEEHEIILQHRKTLEQRQEAERLQWEELQRLEELEKMANVPQKVGYLKQSLWGNGYDEYPEDEKNKLISEMIVETDETIANFIKSEQEELQTAIQEWQILAPANLKFVLTTDEYGFSYWKSANSKYDLEWCEKFGNQYLRDIESLEMKPKTKRTKKAG